MTKKTPFEFGPNQKTWLRWLKTTKRKQTAGALYDGKGYCCLGIACVAMGLQPVESDTGEYYFDGADMALSPKMTKALGLRTSSGDPNTETLWSLENLNDVKEYSFKKIAKVLENNPREYFKKSA